MGIRSEPLAPDSPAVAHLVHDPRPRLASRAITTRARRIGRRQRPTNRLVFRGEKPTDRPWCCAGRPCRIGAGVLHHGWRTRSAFAHCVCDLLRCHLVSAREASAAAHTLEQATSHPECGRSCSGHSGCGGDVGLGGAGGARLADSTPRLGWDRIRSGDHLLACTDCSPRGPARSEHRAKAAQ
jgi:hypothetical protein